MKRLLLLFLALPLAAQAQGYSKGQICKATVALEMSRPVEGIAVIEDGNNPIVSYRRADDGKRFTFSCRVSEKSQTVVWRGYLPEEKAWGRWRDGEYDAKITFAGSNGELKVTSNQAGSKTFKRNQL